MNKPLLTEYCSFCLKPTNDAKEFDLRRLRKNGNNEYFNDLFSVTTVKFNRLNPDQITGDYVLYSLQFITRGLKRRVMLFETSLYLHPFGVVNIADSQDCILFRENEYNMFEIFISAGNKNQTAQLLTMLVDGSLKNEIDEISVIPPDKATLRTQALFKKLRSQGAAK